MAHRICRWALRAQCKESHAPFWKTICNSANCHITPDISNKILLYMHHQTTAFVISYTYKGSTHFSIDLMHTTKRQSMPWYVKSYQSEQSLHCMLMAPNALARIKVRHGGLVTVGCVIAELCSKHVLDIGEYTLQPHCHN